MSDYLVIELEQRRLRFYRNGMMLFQFPIAVGKSQTPSPVGNWHIINKKIIQEPSVFGTRWIGLSNPGYGIHGTNEPYFISTAVSQGCIRMQNDHAEQLFDAVVIGMPVIIVS